jgi:hypothetical protein
MMKSFNRKPTAAEEADFYRRNAGGPVAMTSMTRGRGYFGTFEPAAHVAAYHSRELGQRFDRERDEKRRTYHEAHIDAYGVVYWTEWLSRQKYQHDAHCLARFYHLHPQHRPAWMLNPFLVDAS